MNLPKISPGAVLELAVRIYVWFKISVYGGGKILGGQFHLREHLPPSVASTPVGELSAFDLAWTFFGHSSAYIWLIGLTQLAGGALRLFNRTKLLGVATLLPVLINIIAVDIFFGIPTGATASAILYFSLLGFIGWYNQQRVQDSLVAMLRVSVGEKQDWRAGPVLLLVAAILLVVVFAMLEHRLLVWISR